ncbi:5'/3'-nucleotidase SurE [Peptoniphilus senegalensis]|uniref:5'/3'-nucleotidase SurE n=1 Tax=Peptoniphilus senegalensis TaxID=1465757 RepID=UPI0002E2916E|nr:5'/3'-nucleotidase SurE [Peptoniphilus senegalensis]
MNILVTNDDGINAEGIEVLAKALIDEGHKVTIAAPNVENSGKSHAITFKNPLMVQDAKLEGLENIRSLCVYGTPADCVRAAVHLLDEKFDYCFSGINSGYNTATNVLYSGTVSAAIEANLFNIPAIAVSAQWVKGHSKFDTAAKVAMDVFNKLEDFKKLQVLNINVPYLDYEELKGIEVCKVGADVMSIYDISEDGEGYNMKLRGFPKENNADDSDVYYLGQNYATVSPLLYDVTNLTLINELKEMLK